MTKAVKLKPKRVRVRVRHNGSPMVPPGDAIKVYWIKIEKGTGKVIHSGYVHKILHLCDEVIFIGGGWHPLKDCYLTVEQAVKAWSMSIPSR